jgi:hypothetical protein
VRRHPAFPTPFSWKGGEFSHNSDAFAPRERGRVCCPRRMPIDVVIASAAKQSSFLLSLTMDCFASLAMTVETVCRDATHHPSSPRTRGPITTASNFALRPPTQQPSCPGLSRASTSLLVARKAWMAGTSPAITIPFKRGIRISARCRHPVFPTPFPWKGGEFSHNSDAFAPRENRHSRVVPHAGLPRHSPLSTHQSSSPRRRGPITTGSSFARMRSNSISQHERHGVWSASLATSLPRCGLHPRLIGSSGRRCHNL